MLAEQLAAKDKKVGSSRTAQNARLEPAFSTETFEHEKIRKHSLDFSECCHCLAATAPVEKSPRILLNGLNIWFTSRMPRSSWVASRGTTCGGGGTSRGPAWGAAHPSLPSSESVAPWLRVAGRTAGSLARTGLVVPRMPVNEG